MYDPKSMKAEEFIDHQEILDSLAYADAHKTDAAADRRHPGKGAPAQGPFPPRSLRAARLRTRGCKNQEIYALAEQIKKDFYGNRIVLFAPLYLSNYCVNGCLYCPYHAQEPATLRARSSRRRRSAHEVIALQDMGHKRLRAGGRRGPGEQSASNTFWNPSTPSTPSNIKTAPSAA